jgi:small subunit ribosomal protein S3
MGQKSNPRGFRLVVNQGWESFWYASGNDFTVFLLEDCKIRKWVRDNYGRRAAIDKVLIERPAKSVKVTIFTAKPGVLIGKKGEGVEQIRSKLQQFSTVPLYVSIEEIRVPDLSARLIAMNTALQIEKRVAFRRAMKRALQSAMKAGAIGVKVMISGRLGGADIARPEWYREGRVPLHTLKADIDYAFEEALTSQGIIGIKVWIYRGDINLTRFKSRYVKSVTDSVDNALDEKRKPKRPASKKRTVSKKSSGE